VALVVAAAQVGHSGGQLVYRHGAASAYVPNPTGAPLSTSNLGNRRMADDRRE
jgi:hypothetical protein